jgi:hypothetical protein
MRLNQAAAYMGMKKMHTEFLGNKPLGERSLER